MPRFAFGKRKSTAESENDIAAPSFRVLDRSEVAEGNGKSFDGGVRLSAKTHTLPKTTVSDISVEDNIFADFKPKNRYVFLSLSHSTGLAAAPAAIATVIACSISHTDCQFKFTVSQLESIPGPEFNRNGAWVDTGLTLSLVAAGRPTLPRPTRPTTPLDTALHQLLRLLQT